jgi:hypothetical protein
LAILVYTSISNFIHAINEGSDSFVNHTSNLEDGVADLIEDVKGFLALEIDSKYLSIVKSFVRNGNLYWCLDNLSEYVVIDPKAKKAYHVFEPDKSQLSDKYLCDNTLALVVILDIHDFTNQLTSHFVKKLFFRLIADNSLGDDESGSLPIPPEKGKLM